jgi:hypothetical protein
MLDIRRKNLRFGAGTPIPRYQWNDSFRADSGPSRGGKADRIRSSATSRNLSLVSIVVSMDRLRVVIWKLAHLTFTVTVRPREFAFSHQPQTSSAIAITPASIRAGSIRSSGKVVSEPDDFRSRSG